jgi:hypothetical protein
MGLSPHDDMDVEVFLISILRYDGFLPISEIETNAWKERFGLNNFRTQTSIKFLLADKAIAKTNSANGEGYILTDIGEYRVSAITKTGYSADRVRESKEKYVIYQRWKSDRKLIIITLIITALVFIDQSIVTRIANMVNSSTQNESSTAKPIQAKPSNEKQYPILIPDPNKKGSSIEPPKENE